MSEITIVKNKGAIKRKKNTPMYEVWNRLKKNRMAMGGLIVLFIILLSAIFAPYIIPYDYAEQDYDAKLQLPNSEHWFGTDNFGRDIFSRIIYGGRYTLFISFTCITIAAFIGSIMGLIAAFYSRLDNIIMRIIDIFMGIPSMLMCVSIIAALGSNMWNMMIALCVTAVPEF
ncbi:MAG TPA: ABC transporter permease, partial [Candidatus Enterocola sp.]|nr:ABC transporter permease [Candidatus Enterocola sp.]